MKKNYVMRFAAVLLVLVLLSTCVVSGTFAKYVTKGEATDTATVAKFGVTVTVSSDAFATEYDKDDTSVSIDKTVKSSAADKDVLAPGTKGTLATLSITGTPEVAVNIKYEATLDLGDNWKVDGSEYCPLEIKVGSTIYKLGTNANSIAELEAAVENAIATYEENIEAGTDLSTIDDIEISWSWAFVGDDAKDTALGDAAADGTAPTIEFSLTVTVTQID